MTTPTLDPDQPACCAFGAWQTCQLPGLCTKAEKALIEWQLRNKRPDEQPSSEDL